MVELPIESQFLYPDGIGWWRAVRDIASTMTHTLYESVDFSHSTAQSESTGDDIDSVLEDCQQLLRGLY